jgi:hypothetical protein
MRAALIQAMARDPNGRFDTAQAFANAIRQSLATLGGPASPADLARLLSSDFADEMSTRDEILKAAEEAPLSVPRATAPPITPVRAMPPPLPPAARSGELGERKKPQTTAPPQAVPTMIVQGEGSSRIEIAVPPLPLGVRDLSMAVPEDSWMANPDTNLLRASRTKSLITILVVLGVLAGVGVAAAMLFKANDEEPRTEDPVVTPKAADAAVVPPPGVDAGSGMTKEDIFAISRFGYFTIKANAKTTIYVDGKYIGETPMTRLPLPPGPKKIKAVGPKNKVKQWASASE